MSDNDVIDQPGLAVVRLPGGRISLCGPLPHVAAVVEQQHRAGRLVAATDPAPDGAGGVLVTMRLTLPRRQVAVARPAPLRYRWSRRTVATAAGAGTVVFGGVVAGVWLAVVWVAAHLALVLIVAALATLLAVGVLTVLKGSR